MSLVVCLSTAQFALIAGDGRALDLNTDQIVCEDYQKVYRINANPSVLNLDRRMMLMTSLF